MIDAALIILNFKTFLKQEYRKSLFEEIMSKRWFEDNAQRRLVCLFENNLF